MSDSALIEHAVRELRVAGYRPNSEDKLDYDIWLSTMEIVRIFSGVGHSGYSAAAHTHMITQLLQFKPLGPITDDPDEWFDHGLGGLGDPKVQVWQNKRSGDCFSEDGGKTYYSVNEFRRGWRRKLFGHRGKTHKSTTRGAE